VTADLVMRARRARPPHAALEWAGDAVGAGSEVVHVRALTGGIASSVHALDVVDRRGSRHRLVLRRYLDADDDSVAAAAAIELEGATLLELEASTVPAPRLVAADPSGGRAGAPSLLMSRLPGRMLLTPSDPHRWRRQLAAALPQVHALPAGPAPEVTLMPDPARVEPPPWARDAALWRRAIGIAQQPPPVFSPCFAHGDYQHFNVLWSRERLSGIVDWTFAGAGMPERDVGHCQLNVAILWGADAADDFRALYEAESGRRSDPYWELRSALAFLPGWGHFIQLQAGRRLRVDVEGMNGRVEDLVANITRRL
jgi:aminoglycoside phosphotransferase (APT) family kinase protein